MRDRRTIGCQDKSAKKGVEGKCRGMPWNGKEETIIGAVAISCRKWPELSTLSVNYSELHAAARTLSHVVCTTTRPRMEIPDSSPEGSLITHRDFALCDSNRRQLGTPVGSGSW